MNWVKQKDAQLIDIKIIALYRWTCAELELKRHIYGTNQVKMILLIQMKITKFWKLKW